MIKFIYMFMEGISFQQIERITKDYESTGWRLLHLFRDDRNDEKAFTGVWEKEVK